jgi:hypothetical protein
MAEAAVEDADLAVGERSEGWASPETVEGF